MRYDRRVLADVEAQCDFLRGLVGHGDALVLAQMLEPGIDQERFHHPPWLSRVFEYPPIVGAVAPALVGQAFERGEERLAIAWIDPVFHRDQDRAAIVLDVDMPVMNGLDLCRQLRADAATRDVVVVVVTGDASEQAQAALNAGCDAVLGKPCSRTLLLATIRLLLERR